MEYCEGGELLDRIGEKGHLSEDDVIQIMTQILSALAYCHNKNIIHSDMKAENVLFLSKDFDNLHCKIIDFGMASKYEPDKKLGRI